MNLEFSLSYLSKLNNRVCPTILVIAGGGGWVSGRRDAFMPFQRALARKETQTASFSIRTRATDFISDNDKHYSKDVSSRALPTKTLLR